MAIYGIGAKYETEDVSSEFIEESVIGTGWSENDAPDIHEYFKILEPGDIVYIKSCSYSSNITVKGIGLVVDDEILGSSELLEIGRNVQWLTSEWFTIEKPEKNKNNVRANTIYREFDPEIIAQIMFEVDQHI
jgi:hypothetical protein